MSIEKEKKRSIDETIWSKIDEHTGMLSKCDARVTNLENSRYQDQQSIINYRAETTGQVEKIEDRVEKIMASIENKLENFLNPLLERVGRIEMFMYCCMGGGTVLGALFTILINWESLKHFFKG